MEFVLISKPGKVVASAKLPQYNYQGHNFDRLDAMLYFQGVVGMPDEQEFLRLYEVMTKDEYSFVFDKED